LFEHTLNLFSASTSVELISKYHAIPVSNLIRIYGKFLSEVPMNLTKYDIDIIIPTTTPPEGDFFPDLDLQSMRNARHQDMTVKFQPKDSVESGMSIQREMPARNLLLTSSCRNPRRPFRFYKTLTTQKMMIGPEKWYAFFNKQASVYLSKVIQMWMCGWLVGDSLDQFHIWGTTSENDKAISLYCVRWKILSILSLVCRHTEVATVKTPWRQWFTAYYHFESRLHTSINLTTKVARFNVRWLQVSPWDDSSAGESNSSDDDGDNSETHDGL